MADAKQVAAGLLCAMLTGCSLPKAPFWECRLKSGETIYVRHASDPSEWPYSLTDISGWTRRDSDFDTCRISQENRNDQ